MELLCDINILSTIDGHRIATREFTPFAVTDMVGTIIFISATATPTISARARPTASGSRTACAAASSRTTTSATASLTTTSRQSTALSMHHAIETVFGYTVTTLKEPTKSIFIVGKSLGSVPSVHLSSQSYCADIAGVVLILSLASGARVMLGSLRLPMRIMSVLDDQFAPNIKLIGKVLAPVLLVHGSGLPGLCPGSSITVFVVCI